MKTRVIVGSLHYLGQITDVTAALGAGSRGIGWSRKTKKDSREELVEKKTSSRNERLQVLAQSSNITERRVLLQSHIQVDLRILRVLAALVI
jgi:hypothetical protein